MEAGPLQEKAKSLHDVRLIVGDEDPGGPGALHELLIPQRRRGRHANRAESGEHARGETGQAENERNGGEDGQVERGRARDEPLDRSGDPEAEDEADPEPEQDELHTSRDDEAKDGLGGRAEREANPELACPFGGAVRDEPEEAQRGEDERDERERAEENGFASRIADRARNLTAKGGRIRESLAPGRSPWMTAGSAARTWSGVGERTTRNIPLFADWANGV